MVIKENLCFFLDLSAIFLRKNKHRNDGIPQYENFDE